MRIFFLFIFTLLLCSCSSVNNSSSFDYGTDRGLEDLTIVFDDGTDYYIVDNKIISSTFEKKSSKKTNNDLSKTKNNNDNNSVTIKEKEDTNNEENLIHTSNNKVTLLYPIENVSIKKKYDTSSFKGVEFKVPVQTEIKSIAPGMVIFSGFKASLGNTLFIYHNNGYISIYSNLSELKYKKGDFIKSTDNTIAYASNSFKFELRQRTSKGVIAVNPISFLKER